MKNKNNSPLKTVLIISIGFSLIYLAKHYHWALVTSIIISVLGVSSDYLASKIDYLWMKLAHILSLIVPNILLSLVFYIFLTPIALLSRIFKKQDTLMLSGKTNTTFVNVDKTFSKKSLENPW
jgi:energy-converting hydrogenase Eha subunit E